MTSKWTDKKFLQPYNNCMKKKERGQLPVYYDCLAYANKIYGTQQKKQKVQLRKNLEDPINRHLYSMIVQDKKGELEAQRQEQPVNVDKIHIKLRKKKEDPTINLW